MFHNLTFFMHGFTHLSNDVAPAKFDKMGHVAKVSPLVGSNKIPAFQADAGASTSRVPDGLGSPFFVPKHVVSFR